MAQNVTKLNVLIASPSDVAKEREIARNTLLDWNRLYSGEKGIVFQPLLWETDVYPTLKQHPQEHTNRLLVEKADLAVAILSSRLGSPTQRFVSGTVEEIEQFCQSDRQIFLYFNSDRPGDDDDKYMEVLKFKTALRKKHAGFPKNYDGAEAFGKVLANDLTLWAQDTPTSRPAKLVTEFHSGDIDEWIESWNQSSKEGMILLYNTEHHSFKDFDTFHRIWGNIHQKKQIIKVVFLLPAQKIERLLMLLSNYEQNFLDCEASRYFHVCEYDIGSEDFYTSDSNAVSFSLFCYGTDPEHVADVHGQFQVFILAEPFSKPLSFDQDGGKLRWQYEQVLVFDRETFAVEHLTGLWRKRFRLAECRQLIDIVENKQKLREKKEKILDETKESPQKYFSGRDSKIVLIRDQLLYPNVPSYLLDEDWFLLDWNAAFDLVFPTHLFHRGEYVAKFAQYLGSPEDVFAHGEELEEKLKTSKSDVFDMENLNYYSKPFGRMDFKKMSSPVTDRDSGDIIGHNVVLNVSYVERSGLYEKEVRKAAERVALRNRFATAFDHIMSRFSHFQRLVKAHCGAMNDAESVLDLAAGPGNLTKMLLGKGKRVVAVDFSDLMLDLVRSKCSRHMKLGTLEVLKDNLEVVHSLEDRLFDGAVMLLIFPPVLDLRKCISRVHSLLHPGAPFSIAIPCNQINLPILNRAIREDFVLRSSSEEWNKARKLEWKNHYGIFKEVAAKIFQVEHIHRYDDDELKNILLETGFQVQDPPINRTLLGQVISITAVKN